MDRVICFTGMVTKHTKTSGQINHKIKEGLNRIYKKRMEEYEKDLLRLCKEATLTKRDETKKKNQK
jgi:uncharacterized protein YbjQ (UPF0145 family)